MDGASHFLFCHDDVVLAPDAVRLLLVEEAFRSNAGIASPKYVEWDHPDRLLAVGATADKVGVVQDLVDPGELDQEQHDAVREVLVAPGGATLVRADLFRALGGFNATIDQFGEDLDLSWRARLAGARIVVVPGARVRHLQAVRRGLRRDWGSPASRRRAARLTDEHRVRTLITCYRWYTLIWIVPLALVYLLGESVTRLLQGRPGDAWQTTASFGRAFRSPGRLWRSRRRVQRRRQTSDACYPPAANPGQRPSAGLPAGPGRRRPRRAAARPGGHPGRGRPCWQRAGRQAHRAGLPFPTTARLPGSDRLLARPRPLHGACRSLVGVVLIAVVVFGSRSLLGHELPAVAQLPNTSGGWSAIWRSWWTTWQPSGLGVSAPEQSGPGAAGPAGDACCSGRSACCSTWSCWVPWCSGRSAPTGPPGGGGPGGAAWPPPSPTQSCRCPTTPWPAGTGKVWWPTPPRPGSSAPWAGSPARSPSRSPGRRGPAGASSDWGCWSR